MLVCRPLVHHLHAPGANERQEDLPGLQTHDVNGVKLGSSMMSRWENI